MAELSFVLDNCVIFDPYSSHHLKKRSLLIEKGKISDISGRSIKSKTHYDLKGALLSPGWVDLCAHFCDPGLEHKEDLFHGLKAAQQGGYTAVCLLPNTNPPIETKSDIKYILSKQDGNVDLLPIGALSEGLKGENLTEILDLSDAGAVAFSDGVSSIWNSELLLKALQYIQKIKGVIISRSKDVHLSRNTHMHEGVVSTKLGLRGEPVLSEKLQISQQLEILRYAGGSIHFSMVSSAEGLRLIKSAKKEGLNVTCDVSVMHLKFTDESIEGFDTRYKMDPPFRTEADRKALIKGINDGVVDAIVSGHFPQDRESKYLEFDLAEPGAISLQTVYSTLNSLKDELDMNKAFEALTYGPRRVLNKGQITIEEGNEAVLSVFDPKSKWVVDEKSIVSKSYNTPYWRKEVVGKALATVNHGKLIWS